MFEEWIGGAIRTSWPDLKTKSIKDITRADCVGWGNRFAAKYSPTSFNHTLGILRAILENPDSPTALPRGSGLAGALADKGKTSAHGFGHDTQILSRVILQQVFPKNPNHSSLRSMGYFF